MREGRCVMMRNEKKGMTAGEIADKICEIAPEALQEEKEYRKGKGLLNFCLNFNKKGTELRTFFRILVK